MYQPVFKVLSVEHSENSIVAMLAVDESSEIFKGHFPGQPVAPGACMLQTVKEILADTLGAQIRLVKADNIKFLNMVTPDVLNLMLRINYNSVEDQVKINSYLTSGEQVFMKLQGVFAEL